MVLVAPCTATVDNPASPQPADPFDPTGRRRPVVGGAAHSPSPANLPEILRSKLEGLELVGFPQEPPWQEARPSWAIDASPPEEELLRTWLIWFYGFQRQPGAPMPLPNPSLGFTVTAVAPVITVSDGRAVFGLVPWRSTQSSGTYSLAQLLGRYQRIVEPVLVKREKEKPVYVEAPMWVRPEFINLATTRLVVPSKTHSATRYFGYRGDDAQGGQFGVIPLDVDLRGGDHAGPASGLRLPTNAEAVAILAQSTLPWAYRMDGAGGFYVYLKLGEVLSFEDDSIRAREIIKGAQREVTEIAKARGIHIDLAFTSSTSLCRIPYSYQTKYLLRGQVKKLIAPDLTSGPTVEPATLESLRLHAAEPSTRRRARAHDARRKRDGDGIPDAIRNHLPVTVKDGPLGRIYVLDACPLCKQDGKTAHINEWNWRLTCKRQSCRAANGVEFVEWSQQLSPLAGRALRTHVLADKALSRMAEYPPLKFEGEPTHYVHDFEEGMRVIRTEIIKAHESAPPPDSKGHRMFRMLLLGADCGSGKSYAAARVTEFIPIVYTAPQYSLLDEFGGYRPFQIQGLNKGCLFNGLGAEAAQRGVSRGYLCQ